MSQRNSKNSQRIYYKTSNLRYSLIYIVIYSIHVLFSKGNVDANGKATIVDPDTGRPIYINDGMIPQVEAFASKIAYNHLGIVHLKQAISMLNEKAKKPTGNHYLFICNEVFWNDINDVLDQFLAQYHTEGTYLWSMKANDYVSVGAKGFDTYNWAGNSISFHVDRTFSREFGYEKGYAIAIDLTGDKTSAQPPLGLFTLKGGDMMTSYIKGVNISACAA